MILHVVTTYILCGNDSNYGRSDDCMWKHAKLYDLNVEMDAKT